MYATVSTTVHNDTLAYTVDASRMYLSTHHPILCACLLHYHT